MGHYLSYAISKKLQSAIQQFSLFITICGCICKLLVVECVRVCVCVCVLVFQAGI